jgi:hypothetical protein
MHKTHSGGSWRETSKKLADQIKYAEDIEKAAEGLLKAASGGA